MVNTLIAWARGGLQLGRASVEQYREEILVNIMEVMRGALQDSEHLGQDFPPPREPQETPNI